MGSEEVKSEAFTALFQRHYDPVLRYAQRRAEHHLATDVAAEVFLVAWRRMEDVPADALPWLIGTARRVLANQRRSSDRAETLRLRLRSQRPDPVAEVDERIDVQFRWAAAMKQLPSADQELLALLAWDGLTAREAAASLGCSVSAFAMRLHRARRRLARLLADGTQTSTADVTSTDSKIERASS